MSELCRYCVGNDEGVGCELEMDVMDKMDSGDWTPEQIGSAVEHALNIAHERGCSRLDEFLISRGFLTQPEFNI